MPTATAFQLPNPLPTTLTDWEALLPPAPKAIGNYVLLANHNNLWMTSGTLPLWEGQVAFTGVLDGDSDTTLAVQAAQVAALNALSIIKAEFGSLSAIQQVLNVTGYVASAPDFTNQPVVLNGASDFLVAILGDRGKHTRTAVGVSALPKNATVELALTFTIS